MLPGPLSAALAAAPSSTRAQGRRHARTNLKSQRDEIGAQLLDGVLMLARPIAFNLSPRRQLLTEEIQLARPKWNLECGLYDVRTLIFADVFRDRPVRRKSLVSIGGPETPSGGARSITPCQSLGNPR